MTNLETYILAGLAGGVVRGLSSFLKVRKKDSSQKFKYPYFFSTVLISGLIGGAAGALAESNWKTAFFAGYAGIDFIENMYKSTPFARTAE